MHTRHVLLAYALCIVLSLTSASAFDCPSSTESNPSYNDLRAAVSDFTYLFYTKKDLYGAFNKYVAEDYIQHNANVLDGRDAAISALYGAWSNSAFSFDIAAITIGTGLFDGATMAIVHTKANIRGGSSSTIADMYRLQGTCVVEHWDILQEIDPNARNPHAYF